MTAKRALVVDDSKSARAFLARILERHDLVVDSAESAEQAIEYLLQQRPDVIFMDHLMPGMDGFQAVQAIKNDPRTATIPILMYTSQEGELYLSQARALGALGVLPKQTKPADVSKALYQLKLLPDRRTEGTDTTVVTPAIAPAKAGDERPAAGELPAARLAAAAATDAALSPSDQLRALPPDIRILIESLLRDHTAELRRFVVENLENNADRIVGDMRLMLKDGAPLAPPPVAEPAPRRALWIGAAAALLALLLGALWYLAVENQRQLDARLATLQSQLQLAQERMQAMNRAASDASLAAANLQAAAAGMLPDGAMPARVSPGAVAVQQTLIEPVPFGEAPLAGARVERVQALLERLMSLGFQGTVQIRSFAGRFCVTEAGGEPVTMASEQLPYAKCTQVGNPQDSTRSAQRESVVFANMLAALRQRANGTLDIQVSAGSADEVVSAYPVVTDALTAGEWNRAAIQNNRVELRWSPRPPAAPSTPASG